MRQSFIQLTLENSQIEVGYALDLIFDSKHQCEMLKLKHAGQTKLIDLSKIKKLEAVNNNAAHNFSIQFQPLLDETNKNN